MRKLSPIMENIQKQLYSSLELLSKDMVELGIKFCIIGGMAVNYYGEARMTEDVDILVSRKDQEKIINSPINIFRKKSDTDRNLIYQKTKTPIDIIYSGDDAGKLVGTYDLTSISIEYDHNHVPYISLKDLIKIKMSIGLTYRGRTLKDHGDVVALIKENNLPLDYFFKEKEFNKVYIELWEIANIEEEGYQR